MFSMLSPLAAFWYQILSPISSCIHFQIWFYSPFHTKGVFAWDSLYSSKSIYVNLLKEELEMQESQLNIGGAHKGDCKKAGETFTTG